MAARDILDVEVVVSGVEDEAAFSVPLQWLGFRRFDRPDLASAGRRLFVPEVKEPAILQESRSTTHRKTTREVVSRV